MDLNEATELKVGDRVVFIPVPKQDEYVFQSSVVAGQTETLYPGREYFVSIIEYIGKDDLVIAKNSFFSDAPSPELKEMTSDVWIRLENVADPILFDHLRIPELKSNLTLEESIEDAQRFGKELYEDAVLPEEFLSIINTTNNLGDLPIKDYQAYLSYFVNFFKDVDFKTYETYNIPTPKNMTMSEAYTQFLEFTRIRKGRLSLDLEFVEFMDYMGADTYREMMSMLEEGRVPEKDLIDLYKSGVLKKQEWSAAACWG